MTENPFLQLRRYQVVELKWETLDVFTLVLVPENPDEHVSFQAGQWVYLNLFNDDGSVWARAAFSIASAPEESQEKLELCIKVCGEFTKRVSKLQPDDVVALQGPFGVFTIPEGSRLVFFAGGVGISPLRSMIRSLAARNADTDLYLFYSNKTIEEMAYFEEFRALAKRSPRFHPIFILTREAPKVWEGETGRLDAAMIARHLPEAVAAGYCLCGPPEFMATIRGFLLDRGVDARLIHQEKFG